MSVEALTWALNIAPTPKDPETTTKDGVRRGGGPNSACAFVLVGLANNANADGTDAFPSIATLTRYTRLNERTVQKAIHRLAEAGIILPGREEVRDAKTRPGARPRTWDLNMALMRDDLNEEEATRIDRSVHGFLARWRGVHEVHPSGAEGCTGGQRGVVVVRERGGPRTPEPSLEPSLELPHPAHEINAPSGDVLVMFPVIEAPTPSGPTWEDFYRIYPRKKSKDDVERAWARAVKRESPAVILAAAKRFAATAPGPRPNPRTGEMEDFRPYPAVWLNKGCWADEDEPAAPARPKGMPEWG